MIFKLASYSICYGINLFVSSWRKYQSLPESSWNMWWECWQTSTVRAFLWSMRQHIIITSPATFAAYAYNARRKLSLILAVSVFRLDFPRILIKPTIYSFFCLGTEKCGKPMRVIHTHAHANRAGLCERQRSQPPRNIPSDYPEWIERHGFAGSNGRFALAVRAKIPNIKA